MPRSTPIAAAVLIGAWLGACSEPSHRTAADRSGIARDVRLVELPSEGTPVASDLETGRPVVLIAPAATRRVRVPRPAASVAAMLVVAPSILAVTETRVAEPLEAVPIPESHTIYLAPTGEMDVASPVNIAVGPSAGGEPHIGHDYGGSHGPAIIIRGGMGGVDDKCDLRPRGLGGIAINRIAPPLVGRGGSGGFTRGGIR